MISCADASTMNYTTNIMTEVNPLSQETIGIKCQNQEFRLINCQITPQNSSCHYGEGLQQYVYSSVMCLKGKNVLFLDIIAT